MQNKLDPYFHIISIYFLKEIKAISFPTNSETKDLLQVDFVAFFFSCFIFSHGFLERENYMPSSSLLMDIYR